MISKWEVLKQLKDPEQSAGYFYINHNNKVYMFNYTYDNNLNSYWVLTKIWNNVINNFEYYLS